MRIRYAVSTMLFWWRENHLSFEQECEFLRFQGLGVELRPIMKGSNECRYERRNWPRLAAATKDMLVVMRSRNDNPTLEQWYEQIECARMLDANIVTDLAGLGVPNGPGANGTDFTAKVVEMAEHDKVRLCLESGRLPLLKQVVERFPCLWYCLDTGFANLDSQFSFKQYVDELAPKVLHLHLTDNYGQVDDHQPPGLHDGIGRKNWDYLLSVLSRYDNDLVGSFEMSPSMPAVMLRQASEFLFDELKWPSRPVKKPGYAEVTYNPV